MPVLSPHRGSSGSYRAYASSALDRPFHSSVYTPRISSYSERYTSRSYTDNDGRRIYSRSGSITEDGVTTRFREESHDGGPRRDSVSRDSGISSTRDGSLYGGDYGRRDGSLSRNSDKFTATNVLDSVAEMRNKYSPANYVPAIIRQKNENIARSKSINDIGLPPIEKQTANNTSSAGTKKKVTDATASNSNNTNGVSNYPNTNPTKTTDLSDQPIDDDNGNRASVADLCKKFDDRAPKAVNGVTIRPKKVPEGLDKPKTIAKADGVKKSSGPGKNKGDGATDKNPRRCQGDAPSQSKSEVIENGVESEKKELRGAAGGDQSASGRNGGTRVNHFASYIPSKEYQKKILENGSEINGTREDISKIENDMDGKEGSFGKMIVGNNELSSSTKLSHGAISPTNSISGGLSSNLSTRRSSERDKEFNYRSNSYSDTDEASYSTIRSLDRQQTGKTLGLNGLKNIGNTCFMNSVVQCLSNTRLLIEYLKKDAYVRDINSTTSSMKGALIKAFAEVIKELWSEDSSDRVINTVSLKSQIQRFAPRFIGYAQQDAQEFLRYLLEGLHEDVNRITEKPKPILTEIDEKLSDSEKAAESWSRYLRMDNSKIVEHFVGQLKSTLRCTHCGHCSVTFDPFWDLSLPIPQRTGQLRLSQCLDSFTREETLDGDEKPTCSKCKERRKCTKSFTIQKFPKVLVIHLKRFSPTERFRGKLNVTIDFPLEGLDMSNYAAESTSGTRYNLYAVSNHSGTTYSGHYTAYCRHPYAGSWHEYNDSRVSSVSPKSIVSGEAYVLFYEQEGAKSHL